MIGSNSSFRDHSIAPPFSKGFVHAEACTSEDPQLESKTRAYRWIVGQDGSRQSYAVPLAFENLGQLRTMYTDVWCRLGRDLLAKGPAGARALAGRFDARLPGERVVAFNVGSIMARAIYHFRRGRMTPEQHSTEFLNFGRWFARKTVDHLRGVDLDPQRDVFFGFDTNCLEVLGYLKPRKIFTVVDQVDPGRIEEDMVVEEADRWPGWSKLPGRMPQVYWDRLREEWDIADLVLVNSQWSAEAITRQGVPARKIITVPLAIDLQHEDLWKPVNPVGPLKVLWLGSVILRKGIQYLVEAARLLQGLNIEFLVVGPVGISHQVVRSFPSNIKMLGRVTRSQLTEVYQQANLFVIPTISDGFAITQLEAMAHGLPVIATPNCGSVVTHGVDGLIVPARDSQALADAIMKLDADRSYLRSLSEATLLTIQRYDLPSNARLINSAVARYQANIPA